MELDWRNRCVGGERLEDLVMVVRDLDVDDGDELFARMWDDPIAALPLHRALLRVAAELLWQRAAQLRPHEIGWLEDCDRLSEDAFDELFRRADLELCRSGLGRRSSAI